MPKVEVSAVHSGKTFKITVNPFEVPASKNEQVEWVPTGDIEGIEVKFAKKPFKDGKQKYVSTKTKNAKSGKVKDKAHGEYEYDLKVFMKGGEGNFVIDPRMKVE